MRYPLRTLLIAGALVLGALPLLIYPGILLAGVMSLAAFADPHIRGDNWGDRPLLLVVSTTFLIGSLAYPVVYGPCLIAVRKAKAENENRTVWLSLFPLLYLCVIGLLFLGWMNLDSAAQPRRTNQSPRAGSTKSQTS